MSELVSKFGGADAILPCPFCGANPKFENSHENAWADELGFDYIIECPQCACFMPGDEPEDLMLDWNRRK